MESSIEQLEAQIDAQNTGDSKLAVYRQQASLVQKKRDMAVQELAGLSEERDALARQIAMKEKEYEARQGHKFMKRDDFKAYATQLREKSLKFKKQKDELNVLRHEVGLLDHPHGPLSPLYVCIFQHFRHTMSIHLQDNMYGVLHPDPQRIKNRWLLPNEFLARLVGTEHFFRRNGITIMFGPRSRTLVCWTLLPPPRPPC